MCATLRFPHTAPPGGYQYFQSETRYRIKGFTTMEDTAWSVVAHRQYRNLPRASYQEAIEDVHSQLCERLGSEHCRGAEDCTDFSQNLSGEQIISFSKAFIKHVANGCEFVDIEEAKRRAEICRGCHMNMPKEGCTSCGPLVSFIELAIPAERRFDDLEMCAACGCSLKAKVNATNDVIEAGNKGRNLRMPAHCWQNKL